MEEIKLNIHNIQSEGNEVVIRTGEALPLAEKLQTSISGNIDAVSRYIKQRGTNRFEEGKLYIGTEVPVHTSIITVNREHLLIQLQCDPSDKYAPVVTGQLSINPDLQEFGINSAKKFTREELLSLIKLNRFFFADKDDHAVLMSKIKNFKANVNKDVQDGSDSRGNKNRVNNQAVDTEVPETAVLQIPVFKGEAPSRFIVDICLDVNDGGTRFWLESIDLNELIIKRRDEVFSKEIENFDGFCVIEC